MNPDDETIATDRTYSSDERALLGKLAGMIIGPSAEYDLPGAEDEAIFSEILTKAARFESAVTTGLEALRQIASDRRLEPLALDQNALSALVDGPSAPLRTLMGILTTVTAQAYYQDERVLRSLDMVPRPPFPDGHAVEQGDWSLLEPVRRRGKIFRDV